MAVIFNKDKKRSFISLIVTMAVVFGLIMAGPVTAVRINVKTDKPIYQKDDSKVTFSVGIDIQKNEKVPINHLRLKINDDMKICDFNPDGSSSCSGISITLKNAVDQSMGDMKGEGFGITDGKRKEQETDFGFGYGYGDTQKRSGFNGELIYEITWDISDEDILNGKYKAEIEAIAENNDKKFTYMSNPITFFISQKEAVKPKIINEAYVKSESGNVNYIGDISNFNVEEKLLFWTGIKTLSSNNLQDTGGVTRFSVYAQKDDSTKIDMSLKFLSHKVISFTENNIEFKGDAEVDYHKTKSGTWENGKWINGQPNVVVREKLRNVNVKVTDGKIYIVSNDPKLKFSMTLDVEEFKFD